MKNKCRKKLVAPLIEECTETVEEVKLAKITLAENETIYKCSSCTMYIVLMIVVFTVNVGIVTYYVYSQYYTKKMLHILTLRLALKQWFIKFRNGKSQRN